MKIELEDIRNEIEYREEQSMEIKMKGSRILIVVDMQKDFVTGVLGSEAAQEIVPRVVNKIHKYMDALYPIIYTYDLHEYIEDPAKRYRKEPIIDIDAMIDSYKDTVEGKRIIPHCFSDVFVHGLDGAYFIPEIYPLVNQYRYAYNIKKSHFSAGFNALYKLFSDHFISMEDLNKQNQFNIWFESVEIIGLCTDICVISNAFTIRDILPETEIYIDPTCCAGSTPEKHDAALKVLESCCFNVTRDVSDDDHFNN